MENIVLTVHLLLALALVGVVLIQRSEGGGLGMGSGGGDSVMSGRAAASALTKLTWIFAVAFIITSISLIILVNIKSTIFLFLLFMNWTKLGFTLFTFKGFLNNNANIL